MLRHTLEEISGTSSIFENSQSFGEGINSFDRTNLLLLNLVDKFAFLGEEISSFVFEYDLLWFDKAGLAPILPDLL